jgi:flagellar biosynthetic protein FliR
MSTLLERILFANAATYALVIARLSGFVVVSPFPGNQVNRTARITLVAVLAWIVTSFAPTREAPKTLDLALALVVGRELAVGLLVGLTFQAVFWVAEITGQVTSQAVGLSQPATLNPTMGTQDMVMSRIISLFALLLAVTVGVHRIALGMLLESFRAIPVGSAVDVSAPAMALFDLTVSSFTVGILLALPILAVAFVVQLGLAMIARAAPALQIFSVGWAVLLAVGAAILVSSVREIGEGLVAHMGSLAAALDHNLTALVSGAGR